MSNEQHKKTKKTLKIVGISMLAVGAVFTLIGFINFFSTFGSFDSPDLFWCSFVGLPLLGFGGMITLFAFKGEIAKYVKNESVPVANEAAQELTPAVKSVVSAAKSVLEEESTFLCPSCGEKNDKDSKFCKNCGTAFSVVCPSCGQATDAGKFCNHCGKEL